MFDWLPYADTTIKATSDGGSMDGSSRPWRLVLHTTEGDSFPGYANGYWPQLTAEIRAAKGRRLWQHLPFSRAGRALSNLPGGVETNRHYAVQVEIVGFTAQCSDWLDDDVAWLGAQLAPLFDQLPILRQGPPRAWVDARDGFVARTDAPQRLTFDEWDKFSGCLGHQHVPENDHYDPGRFDITTFLTATRPHATITEDDDMPKPRLVTYPHASAIWVFEGARGRALGSPDQLTVLEQFWGIAVEQLTQPEVADLLNVSRLFDGATH